MPFIVLGVLLVTLLFVRFLGLDMFRMLREDQDERIIERVNSDGSRTRVDLTDIKKGDRFIIRDTIDQKFVNYPIEDGGVIYEALADSFINTRGVATIQVEDNPVDEEIKRQAETQHGGPR